MRFEWHPQKAATNLERHGVSFEEAATLLERETGVWETYDKHSGDEDRFIAIGASVSGVLVVVFTEREADVTRVISARRATKRESRLYLRHLSGDQS